MMEFQPVRCPVCSEHPVVMEILIGCSRGKCPNTRCKRRIWAESDGHRTKVRVDSPKIVIASSA